MIFNTNKELVDYLNSLQILQTSSWDECISEDIWDTYFDNKIETVETDLNIDRHRWYELSTEVISIRDGYIGIRSVTNCYSESSSVGDMYHLLEFFEMEPEITTTYVKK